MPALLAIRRERRVGLVDMEMGADNGVIQRHARSTVNLSRDT
jgi:hypothetical protein